MMIYDAYKELKQKWESGKSSVAEKSRTGYGASGIKEARTARRQLRRIQVPTRKNNPIRLGSSP